MEAERIRVLLVDDDQGDFEMTRAMISQIETRKIDLDWVPSFEEGLDALVEGEHDVYLIDYFLEDRTGMDLLREARQRSIKAPLIMLTGRGNRQVDLEAMKAGASDYLVKGRIDPELLERSIRFALERYRAEKALRESEERHRGMFDHLPIGLYRSSPDGEFLDANPALVRILGHPDRETLAREYAPSFYVSDDDRDRFWELLEARGVVRGFESRIRRHDGEEIRVRNTARVHRTRDGSIVYVEGSLEDVTDAVPGGGDATGHERFQVVYEEGSAGIVLVDTDGLIVDVNPAFTRLFGYTTQAARDRSFVDLAVEEDRREILDSFRAVSKGERDSEADEWRWKAADGTDLWARTKTALVRDESGSPDHLVVLFEEVSEAV